MRCYRFVYFLLSCLASFLHRLLRRSVATETRVSLQRLPMEPEAELFGFSTMSSDVSPSWPVVRSCLVPIRAANQSASGKPSSNDPGISQHIGCNNPVKQVQPLSRPSSALYLTFFVILRLLPEMIVPSGIKRVICVFAVHQQRFGVRSGRVSGIASRTHSFHISLPAQSYLL